MRNSYGIGERHHCFFRMLFHLILTMLSVFLINGFIRTNAWADVTIAYDIFGNPLLKPAGAGNSQTGNFLAVYLSPQECSGVTEDEARATLRNAFGNAIITNIAPLGTCNYRAVGRPAVAYSHQSDRFCIAVPASDRPSGSIDYIRVGFLNGDGSDPGIPVQNILGADQFYYMGSGFGALRVVHNSLLDEFVITAQVKDDGLNQILARRITPTGTLTGYKVLSEPTTNGFQSHGIAHAPVSGTSPTGGRYLFVRGRSSIQLLDAELNPILVTATDPNYPDINTSSDIPIRTGDPSSVSEFSDHADVAYGVVEGQNRFLVIYSDENNCKPPRLSCPNIPDQNTGVWGTYIDPEKMNYTDFNPNSEVNTPFPITSIYTHADAIAEWQPTAAFHPDAEGFFVVWREIPFDHGLNDEILSHIRGTFIDRFLEDGLYGQELPDWPPENFVLSDVTGVCIPGAWPYECISDQDPDFPDVFPVGFGRAMAIWHEYHDPPPSPPFDWPANWSIRGDRFPADVAPPPDNDDRINAELVAEGAHQGTLVRATNDGSASCGISSNSPDVWYLYQVYSTGTLKVSTCGSNDYYGIDTGVDTVISLHDPDDGSQLDGHCNDDWHSGSYTSACFGEAGLDEGGLWRDSAISARVFNGDSILIRVANFNASKKGPFNLQVEFVNDPDQDGDGWSTADGDCDDNDNTVYPNAPELCDGKDNDCNGASTDGSGESWFGQLCDGSDTDLCNEGTFSCNGGQQVCSDNTGNNIELCDGLDNDCNGVSADGSGESWFGQLCDGSDTDLCNEGTFSCNGGQQVCSDNTGNNIELCDGLDNDCDGGTDEGLTRTTTCGVGECAGNSGVETCSAGVWGNDTCAPFAGATAEVCDGLDNDCDGVEDINENGVCNTLPDGDNPVTVEDDSGQVTVTFPSVTEEGNTDVTVENCQETIDGFVVIPTSAPVCVDITTTAGFNTPVIVCITYDDTGMTLSEEEQIRIVRYDPGPPPSKNLLPFCDPPPDPVDTVNNIACGCTDQFSTFAAGYALDSDEDGIPDLSDNCPDVWDPSNLCDGCLSDTNHDEDVDGLDLVTIINAYGTSSGDQNFNPSADLNGDSFVDEIDLALTAMGFGRIDCIDNP